MEELNGRYSHLETAYAKIYTLSGLDGIVFYVGCTTKTIQVRVAAHIYETKTSRPSGNKRKMDKIKELDYNIVATVIDTFPLTGKSSSEVRNKAYATEQMWIKKYRDLGFDLTNRPPATQPDKTISDKDYIGRAYIFSNGGVRIIDEGVTKVQ